MLQDQLPFMLRCGFDSFESDQKGFGEALAKARTLFSVVYQPTEDGRATAALLRLNRRNVKPPSHIDVLSPRAFGRASEMTSLALVCSGYAFLT